LRSGASKFNETVAVPAVIGAVGGGLLGGLLCDKKRASCAVKGAAAGALLGGGAGYLVAVQNEKIANREAEWRARNDAAKVEVERFDQVINAPIA
jgi:outer membrane lipoprotein SlyB